MFDCDEKIMEGENIIPFLLFIKKNYEELPREVFNEEYKKELIEFLEERINSESLKLDQSQFESIIPEQNKDKFSDFEQTIDEDINSTMLIQQTEKEKKEISPKNHIKSKIHVFIHEFIEFLYNQEKE